MSTRPSQIASKGRYVLARIRKYETEQPRPARRPVPDPDPDPDTDIIDADEENY
jgi:hypothetical protein